MDARAGLVLGAIVGALASGLTHRFLGDASVPESVGVGAAGAVLGAILGVAGAMVAGSVPQDALVVRVAGA